MQEHIVYILSNHLNDVKGFNKSRGPIFIGETSDLLYRMTQHRSGRPSLPAFTIDRLVYVERYACPYKAKTRAAALKTASREWVDALISSNNPMWQELLPATSDSAFAA